MTRQAGLAARADVIVGLIVAWTGLAAGNQVAWAIIVLIVLVWAFPTMTWPLLTHERVLTLSDTSEWVAAAWRRDGLERTCANR